MKISVALTTYNGTKYISKQLDSIVKQSMIPNEIVITDDSENDDTYNIIKKYINCYKNISFNYIKNNKKLGFCNNFFKAILNTTGDIIFLSDQDDIWDNTKIEEMTSCIENDFNIRLLCCKYRCIDKNDNVISKTHEYSTSFKYFIKSKLLNKNYFNMNYTEVFKILSFPGMSYAIKKEVVEDLKHFLDIVPIDKIIFHDVILAYLSSIKNGFYIYNKTLINYRMHGDNAIGINTYNNKGKTDRVVWLDEIIGNQKSILEYEKMYNKDEQILKYISALLKFNVLRYEQMKNKQFFNILSEIIKTKYILSIKSYLGDVIYTFK